MFERPERLQLFAKLRDTSDNREIDRPAAVEGAVEQPARVGVLAARVRDGGGVIQQAAIARAGPQRPTLRVGGLVQPARAQVGDGQRVEREDVGARRGRALGQGNGVGGRQFALGELPRQRRRLRLL